MVRTGKRANATKKSLVDDRTEVMEDVGRECLKTRELCFSPGRNPRPITLTSSCYQDCHHQYSMVIDVLYPSVVIEGLKYVLV